MAFSRPQTSAAECTILAIVSALLFPVGVALSALALWFFGTMTLEQWPLGTVDNATGVFTPAIPFRGALSIIVPHVFWAIAAAGGTAACLWAWQGVHASKRHLGLFVLLVVAPLTLLGAWLALPLLATWGVASVTLIGLSLAFLAGVVATVFKLA